MSKLVGIENNETKKASGLRTCVVRSALRSGMLLSCLYFKKATGAGMPLRGLMLG